MIRVGFGYDVHQFAEGRKLWLGGIEIPHEKGLLGHSDADVLLHSITDALLGAVAKGDIGSHFPDTDPAWKDADSAELLKSVWHEIRSEGWELGNIDATVVTERPKLRPFIDQICERIAEILGVERDLVSVKATTNEKMGFTGREEGIAAYSVASLYRVNAMQK
jgi:2-C-methyl-D-erythritol 2,4-cyclodiphosphate synthase